jgi:hypothetical protein
MNWVHDNHDIFPSSVENPNDDILKGEHAWIQEVKRGSERYAASKKKQAILQEAGIDTPEALLDLGQDVTFYRYIFQYLRETPPLPTNGDKHDHQVYEAFLDEFRQEMATFLAFMQTESLVDTQYGKQQVTQGGLIVPEFMEFANIARNGVVSQELQEMFYTDAEVYRGAMIDGKLTDTQICELFLRTSGVASGYRALQNAHLSPTTQMQVPSRHMTEAMDYYNKMIAKTYLAKKHPYLNTPYANDQNLHLLDHTVKAHVGGWKDIWISPFVSTSTDPGVSREWAQKFGAQWAQDSHHGVFFVARVPKSGVVITHGAKDAEGLSGTHGLDFEREVLITGGIQPSSIEKIEVYDRSGLYGIPGVIAERVLTDTGTQVVIRDLHADLMTMRTYTYDESSKSFVLASEEQTDIPSINFRPKITHMQFPPKISSYFQDFYEEYTSPFYQEKKSNIKDNYSFEIKNDLFTFSKAHQEKANFLFKETAFHLDNDSFQEKKTISTIYNSLFEHKNVDSDNEYNPKDSYTQLFNSEKITHKKNDTLQDISNSLFSKKSKFNTEKDYSGEQSINYDDLFTYLKKMKKDDETPT